MLSIADIDINGRPADELTADVWLEAIDVLKVAAKDQATEELATLKAREAQLRMFLDSEAATVDEPKARVPAKPKYRHPDNPGLTWTGRGKKPEWMAAWIASGKDPEDLRIIGQAHA